MRRIKAMEENFYHYYCKSKFEKYFTQEYHIGSIID